MYLLRELCIVDMGMEDDIILRNENNVPSISDLIRDCQYGNSFHLAQLMYNSDGSCNMSTSPNCTSDEIKNIKEEGYDDDSNDSSAFVQEQLPVSLFKETKPRQQPWSNNKSFPATGTYFFLFFKSRVACMTYKTSMYITYMYCRWENFTYDSSRRSIFVTKNQ